MNIGKMKQYADQKMCDGCNCCESVLWSYLSTNGQEHTQEGLYTIATIFGGGIASTHEEICGALSGALMVLSIQGGRTNCSVSNESLMEQGQKLRDAFIANIGPTKCGLLRESLNQKYGTVDCRKIVQDCIELLSLFESKS